ncbi:MAG: YqaE/Pmp3 family membrane protein [Fuerstiella sp.]|nr:YqaE/Pmp3 family membrane protein [Fuerstiella sp.]
MRYFLSFLLPPLAVLLCGKPLLGVLNLVLTLLGWIPGVIHALLVVNDHKRDLRVIRHGFNG